MSEPNVIAKRIGLLLVDDSDLMRTAVLRLLKTEPRIDVLGEARNFEELLKMATELKPRVIVMDLHMPGEKGLEPGWVADQLRGSSVLVISIWVDEEAKALAKSYGAIKHLDKNELGAELIPAILNLS